MGKKKIAEPESESDIKKKYALNEKQFDYLKGFAEKLNMSLEEAAKELQLESPEAEE